MSILEKFSLAGKKAIVTGAARGLCYGIAEGLHEAGAEVVIVDILDIVEQSAKEMGSFGAPVYGVKGNMDDLDDLKRAFADSLEKLGGRVDILVNGAGVQHRSPVEEFPEDAWYRVININLNAVFFMAQLAGRVMLKQGYGKIINVGSLNSFRSVARNIAAYQSAKSAVRQLCQTLADEWSEHGIRTNGIAPGWTRTEMTGPVAEDPNRYPDTLRCIPLGHWATPADFKGITILLASHAGDFINGTMIPVDGGHLAR